jgi:Ca2+-binding EF-hand superfamily protein
MRSFQPPSFKSIDSDSNGSLTLDEFKANAPGKASDANSAKRAEQLFKSMDADGDGSVTSTEKDAFDTKMADQRQSMQFTTQMLAGPSNQDVFSATDKDADGKVSLEEFSDSDAADGVSTDQLQQLFSAIDSDGDGSITETESSSFLDAIKTASNDDQMAPPQGEPHGPGGPRGPGGPGGPPPGADSDEDEDSDSTAVDLLTAATANNAYSSTKTVSDLLSTLTSILDQAA